MPASVPGVTLDKDGICNFCHEYEAAVIHGREELDRIVERARKRGGRYDCIVPMSGGRDSTYALYVARAEYNLKTLAVNYNNKFQHDQAMANIKKACEILKSDFITVRSEGDISHKLVLSTLREELSLGYVKQPNICKACSYGIKSVPYREAEKHGVPLIIYAGSQEEKCQGMISRVMHAVPVPFRRKLLGRLNRFNPYHWMVRYHEVMMKREFPVPGNSAFSPRVRPTLRNKQITELHLFDYIPWDRKKIKETITTELGWQKTPGYMSSWRNDCALHQYINYDFFRRYGCSRDCFGYCRMINAGKMTREEALEQEEALLASFETGAINNVNIEEFLRDTVGLSRRESRIVIREA